MFGRPAAFAWKTERTMRRSVPSIFDVFFWPVMGVLTLGFFAKYAAGGGDVLKVLMIGTIGWSAVFCAQRELSVNFLSEIWDRTIKRTRVVSMHDAEYVFGNWLVGMLRSALAVIMTSLTAYLAFGFNVLDGDAAAMLLLWGGALLSSLVIGMFVISVIKVLGHRAEMLAWSLTDVMTLLSGIYYPVSVFPAKVKALAMLSPLTYVFDGLRRTIIGGEAASALSADIARMYVLAFAYVGVTWMIYVWAEKRAMKSGFYQKYG